MGFLYLHPSLPVIPCEYRLQVDVFCSKCKKRWCFSLQVNHAKKTSSLYIYIYKQNITKTHPPGNSASALFGMVKTGPFERLRMTSNVWESKDHGLHHKRLVMLHSIFVSSFGFLGFASLMSGKKIQTYAPKWWFNGDLLYRSI